MPWPVSGLWLCKRPSSPASQFPGAAAAGGNTFGSLSLNWIALLSLCFFLALRGGRGLGRRTFQPRDIAVENVNLEYVNDTSVSGSGKGGSKVLLDNAYLKLLPGRVYTLVGRNGVVREMLVTKRWRNYSFEHLVVSVRSGQVDAPEENSCTQDPRLPPAYLIPSCAARDFWTR